ncbi:TrkA C-terminal domain-containing protein [Alkaliphilus peptidifermentans]|uniref:TrkA-C domain-containing protein n=1 Tax=Alkaliphilus peptidifermentans DSM 18978 TaxID=1120976 RepID=A0A1G5KUH7_9FIRM|nr:TrkA C-terminal domain-containing protein [Alkaliphilus peptidifermentans]SCZ03778.1 TrkA-C domain-containing protein [Alkaliphilus peptidifermentans DSM 18978]
MPITYGILVLVILAILVEILSVALKVTGLDLEKARFQVVSMITHTGFTTRESELITQHPTRRKIALVLMLVSYVTTATLISVIVNAFRNYRSFLNFTLFIAFALFIVLFLIRNKRVLYRLEGIIEKQLSKQMKINSKYKTVEEVLKLNDEYGVAEFVIEEGNELIGVTLEKSNLKRNFIQVLNIDRGSHIIHFPKNNTLFRHGDKVIVYGQIEKISEFILNQRQNMKDE